jgi:hypothetical protein
LIFTPIFYVVVRRFARERRRGKAATRPAPAE